MIVSSSAIQCPACESPLLEEPKLVGVGYPVDETALKHGAGVEVATNSPKEAYAKFAPMEPQTYPHGLLPE